MEITTDIKREKWSRFVEAHPMGNIFQAPEMSLVFEETDNYDPIMIAALEDDEISGIVSGTLISEGKGIKGSFSTRCIVQNGPLIKGQESVGPLMEGLIKLVENGALYTQLRNGWDMSSMKSAFDSLGFSYEPHLNFLIDLERDEEQVIADMHKSRRKGVRRAVKRLKAIPINDLKGIDTGFELISKTYERVGVPLADKSLFISAFKNLQERGYLKGFIAEDDGIPVASRIALCYKDTVHDWYAGSDPDIKDVYANEFLVWKLLQYGCNGPYKAFDFGGGGHPDEFYGPREFKRRFGGQEVNFGRFEKVHKPGKLAIGKAGLKVLNRF